MPEAVRRHSRDQQLANLIDRICKLPATKPRITDSTAAEAEFLLSVIRTSYLSRWPTRDRVLKSHPRSIEAELAGDRRREVIQNFFRSIKDEIIIR